MGLGFKIDFSTAYIIIAGLVGGIVSAWVLRIGEQITNSFFIGKVKSNYIPVLRVFIDLAIGLFMMLIIILMID